MVVCKLDRTYEVRSSCPRTRIYRQICILTIQIWFVKLNDLSPSKKACRRSTNPPPPRISLTYVFFVRIFPLPAIVENLLDSFWSSDRGRSRPYFEKGFFKNARTYKINSCIYIYIYEYVIITYNFLAFS